jgi:hypothetical protein
MVMCVVVVAVMVRIKRVHLQMIIVRVIVWHADYS